MIRKLSVGIAVVLSLACSFQAMSTIQIMTTRVVLNAAEKEQSVRINNVGAQPTLTQVWLSTTEKNIGAEKEQLPFFINPPVARINSQKGKVFRIFQTDEAINKYPKDRETMLWLNVLDIPPELPEDANKNQIKMAFRTLIKFFYRPAGLKGNPMEAADNLTWELQKTAKGYAVTGTNRSPYYVSMTNAWLLNAEGKESEVEGQILAPYSQLTYHFPQVNAVQGKGVFKYNYITDLGAYIKRTYTF
ncbi:TPA: molecular chaperone [Citrobacter sedlakii]